MKFTCVCILFICLAAATFSNWLLIASFNLNQTYIAKELCVNRNNSGSNCNGHCYLCKQLNKAERPEGANGSSSKEKFEVQLFFVDAAGNNTLLIKTKRNYHIQPQQFSSQLYLKGFFHPPAA